MSLFITVTHAHSGEKMFIRADKVDTIRVKEGRTLIITPERGMYVLEPAELVRDSVDAILLLNTIEHPTIMDQSEEMA
jgi:hypothetical protein